MQPRIQELINEFTTKLAAELAQLPASELVKLGESVGRTPGRPTARPAAMSGGSRGVTQDQVVEVVKQRDTPVKAEQIAVLLHADRIAVSRALKAAVDAGRIQREGQARGTTYSAITINAPHEVAPESEPAQRRIDIARNIAKKRSKG